MSSTKKKSITLAIIGLALFLFVFSIHLPWIDFAGKAVGDTPGYMDVSINWFSSDHIYIRPIFYPLFLYLARFLSSNEFGSIVLIQVLFYSFSAVLFFRILIINFKNINAYILVTIVAVSFAAPQALFSNGLVLPEMLPLFFILGLLYFLQKELNLRNSILTGLLIVIPILFKPLWILLFFLPLLRYIYQQKSFYNLIYGVFIPIGISLCIYSINQYAVAKSGTNALAASTFDMNINLSLIRMGIIEDGKNTTLYNYLEQRNLIEDISNRQWDNSVEEFNNFTELKNQIPTRFREDSEFWKNILINKPGNLIHYLSFQVMRLPAFFSTSAANHEVHFLPKLFNRMYQSFFYNIHSKHLIGVSFIFFALSIGLLKFKSWNFNKSVFFLVLGTALVISLLVYQNAHFLRMRAIIEPFLIYIFLFSLYKIASYFLPKVHFILKRNMRDQ